MKGLFFSLLLLLFSAVAASQSSRPVPRGVRDGEQAVYQGEQDVPPPANRSVRPSLQQVQREASQLAALTHDLPTEVDSWPGAPGPRTLSRN